MMLFINTGTDFAIVDESGNEYSVDQAKELAKKGKVECCDKAFWRLGKYGYDMKRLRRFYNELGKECGTGPVTTVEEFKWLILGVLLPDE